MSERAGSDSWIQVLRGKAADIESIAQWASIVNHGRVRDLLRMARAELLDEIEHRSAEQQAMEGLSQ